MKVWAFCKTALSIAWAVDDHGSIPELELEIPCLKIFTHAQRAKNGNYDDLQDFKVLSQKVFALFASASLTHIQSITAL